MPNQRFEFGDFQYDAARQILTRANEQIRLKTKACELLQVLLERRGEILEKENLMNLLWPDTAVEENNLTVHMTALRKALGDNPVDHRFILTIPGRGYRFVADVTELTEEAEIIVTERTRTMVTIEEEPEAVETAIVPEPATEAIDQREIRPKNIFKNIAPSRPRRFLLAAIILTALLFLGTFYWRSARSNSKSQTSSKSQISNFQSQISNLKSLAVLPFKSITPKAGEEYLSVGLADVLITRLSNIRSLAVRPTNSVIRFSDQDPLQAGKALQVDSVLDGSIQQIGDRVRVTVRLLRISDGQPLWAYQCDQLCNDAFQLQDLVSSHVAQALQLQLTGEEKQRLQRRDTGNPEAYQAYLKGRFFWSKWNQEGAQKSAESFEQAIAADPNYGLAYSGLADAWNLLGYRGYVPPREAFPKSEAAALQAIKLDDSLGEAHVSLAKTKLFYNWDGIGFERELQRAFELNPNYADAYGMQATYLTAVGKFDEAIAARQRALELDPTSALFTNMTGWPYFYAHRYDEAIQWYRKALELDPNLAQAHNDLGITYRLQGRNDAAIGELLKALALAGAKPETIEALRQAYATGGFKVYAQKNLELIQEQIQQGKVRAWNVAAIYRDLDDRDHAFEWLEKAYQDRESLMIFLKVLPQYDQWHNDPRFIDLIRRIGIN